MRKLNIGIALLVILINYPLFIKQSLLLNFCKKYGNVEIVQEKRKNIY